MKLSIRAKLTLGYIGTVTTALLVFVGADVVGLRSNLLSRAGEGVPSESLQEAWQHALWEHGMLMVILIGLVSIMGTFFIRRVFRPVRRIVRTARSITAEDLSLRVDDLGDRDEIGELARTFNDMIARIENGFRQVQRFSGDASHEMNTPLTVMKSELEVALRKERTSEEYRGILGRLLDEVNRLSDIVEDLLFLSRVDARCVERSQDEVALHQVVLEAFEENSRLAGDRSVTVQLKQVDESEVKGDASLFRRMVSNLLDNAIKFTPGGGTVTVSLADGGESTTLVIEDGGAGIDQEEIPKIFERFYRADPSRSKQTGGVGLGLSIVREIADLYDLELRVESEKEIGTSVTAAWKRS
jgi:heavy metal sensor kinase